MSPQDKKIDKPHSIDKVGAILSMNKGLLDAVSPVLRAVQLSWDAEMIYLYFYFDGEISEEDLDAAQCSSIELVGAFPGYLLDDQILRWDFPKPIPQGKGVIVYWRQEPYIEEESARPIVKVKLSLNRALLRKVPPSLREAACKIREKTIDLYFIFHGEISDFDRKLADFVAFSVSIDFPSCMVVPHVERIDFPRRISLNIVPEEGGVVYFRRHNA